jgi:RimJ/RimL family protein N-acetyltransferase
MPNKVVFRIEHSVDTVGEISLSNIKWYNRKAFMTIILAEEFHGKGLGYKASMAALKYAFEAINLHRIEAETTEYNPKSAHLLKKLGFTQEGVLREAKYYNGKYHDIIRFGLLRKEFEKLIEKNK